MSLIYTQQETWKILQFFFKSPGVRPGDLTDDDRAFAQALLLDALEMNYAMGFVAIIFKSFFGKTATNFAGIAKLIGKFLTKGFMHWFKHTTKKDLKDVQMYESIRLTVARNWTSIWRIRVAIGDLDY